MPEDQRIDIGPHSPLHDRSAGQLRQPLVYRELLFLRESRFEADTRIRICRCKIRRDLLLRLAGDARQLRQLDRSPASVERQPGGNHLQAPDRAVGHQRHAMAVVDDSAIGLEDHPMHGVGARHAGQDRAIGDLELGQLDCQPAYHQHGQQGGGYEPHGPASLGGHASQLDQTGSGRLVTGECSLRTTPRTMGIRAAL